MPDPTVNDLVENPDWIPHTYDMAGDNLVFVNLPREARSELMFLSDEHFKGEFRRLNAPVRAVATAAAQVPQAPVHFIFHTSFCCSTLLAKALDVPGVAGAMKEPDVLINVANRLVRSDDPANRQRLELVLRLLERPFAPGEAVVVKPTNFANRLVEPLLSMRPDSRAVLLYSGLDTFLRSLLKRGMWGRITGRKLYSRLAAWSPVDFGFTPGELFEQTDLQVAALAWLMQIQHFDAIASAFGPERVMVLDSATLLADPAAALDEVQQLFGLHLAESQVREIAGGPVFSRHSKFSDRDYSADERDRDHRDITDAHREELAMVVQWVKAIAAGLGLPMQPGARGEAR